MRVTSSGIAVLYLQNRRNIKKQSLLEKFIKGISLIIQDKIIIIVNKSGMEALDHKLRDLRHNNYYVDNCCPMGGMTVTFTEDFKQILSVFSRGTKSY